MSTLLLFILFAFVGFALWIGYTAYRSMQKKRGPVPPGNPQPGAQPAEQARRSSPGAQPAEQARSSGPGAGKPRGTKPAEGPPQSDAERQPQRPESEAGPKRRDENESRT